MRFAIRLLSHLMLAASLAMVGGAAASATAPGDTLAPLLDGLVGQDGRPMTPQRLAGKLVLVNFIFTRCGSTCPLQTAELSRFVAGLSARERARLAIVSITVDPGYDNPARLATYAEAFGIDGQHWTFLTGRPDLIVRVSRAFSAFRPNADGSGNHIAGVRLFDTQHRMIQRYAAMPLAARQFLAPRNLYSWQPLDEPGSDGPLVSHPGMMRVSGLHRQGLTPADAAYSAVVSQPRAM